MALVKRENTLFFNKRKETTFDYEFMDQLICENFYVGGTDLVIFKLAGSWNQYNNLLLSSMTHVTFTAGSTFAQQRGPKKAFDNNDDTYYKSAAQPASPFDTEFILVDLGDDPKLWLAPNGLGIKRGEAGGHTTLLIVEGSQNGLSFNQLACLSLSNDDSLQRFTFDNAIPYRYLRFRPEAGTYSGAEWAVATIEVYQEAGEDGGCCAIEDTFLLETRSRRYEKDGCAVLCHYIVPDKPHDLSNFGFIIPTDQFEITVSIRHVLETLGRRICTGDIVTLPHVGDHSFDEGGEIDTPKIIDPKTPCMHLGRQYEVVDTSITAAGYDVRWRDHLQTVLVAPLREGFQTADVTQQPQGDPAEVPDSTRDLLNDLADQAHLEATAAGELGLDLSGIAQDPEVLQQTGPHQMDSFPPNDAPYTDEVDFPVSASSTGVYFRHIGYDPPRLYRWDGTVWRNVEIESRVYFDGRFTIRGDNKEAVDLPTENASAIQQSLTKKT